MDKLLTDINKAANDHFPTCPTRRAAFKKGAYAFMNPEIEIVFKRWMEWSTKTFEKADQFASLEKLKDEIKEVQEGFTPDEYADCFMCLLHSMARAGVSWEQLFLAFKEKFTVNTKREWLLNDNNTYSHKK